MVIESHIETPAVAKATTGRMVSLAALCLSAPLLIPHKSLLVGAVLWAVCAVLVFRDADPRYRRRMGTLLVLVALLAAAPINTNLNKGHFLSLGLFFLAAVVGPALYLSRTDPGLLDFRILPRSFRLGDLVYALIAIPLSWSLIRLYFFHINPDIPGDWPMPPVYEKGTTWTLIAGINAVGIWDELFFVNTVYAILRSLFPVRIANIAQGFIYTSVLYTMAFSGVGPILVYGFALTQGSMYESARCLLYVLIVHLIVDAFLVAGIIEFYYPGQAAGWF